MASLFVVLIDYIVRAEFHHLLQSEHDHIRILHLLEDFTQIELFRIQITDIPCAGEDVERLSGLKTVELDGFRLPHDQVKGLQFDLVRLGFVE